MESHVKQLQDKRQNPYPEEALAAIWAMTLGVIVEQGKPLSEADRDFERSLNNALHQPDVMDAISGLRGHYAVAAADNPEMKKYEKAMALAYKGTHAAYNVINGPGQE